MNGAGRIEVLRKRIIEQLMSERGALIKVRNLDEAIDVANFIVPEHLELTVENAQREVATHYQGHFIQGSSARRLVRV